MKNTCISNQQNWLNWKGIAPKGRRNESVHGGCQISSGLASLKPRARCNSKTSTGENGFPPSISNRDVAQKLTKSVSALEFEAKCESPNTVDGSSAQKRQRIAHQRALHKVPFC